MRYQLYNLLPVYGTNTYLVWDEESREAILIDPAAPSEMLWNEIQRDGLKLNLIIITHGHGDHIGGNNYFTEKALVPTGIHRRDAAMLLDPSLNLSSYMGDGIVAPEATIFLDDGMKLTLGKSELLVLHTPGHTPGGICLYTDNYLFSGDTLFAASIGRSDFPGGDESLLKSMIQTKLFALPDETIVLPGHGPYTTIGQEKKENPFVRPIR